jgi:adenylate cyclase
MPRLARFSISTRRKVVSILLIVAVFTMLVGMTSLALGHPFGAAITNAVLVGIGVGVFEEFYFQTSRGTWLRNLYPLLSISIYTAVVVVFVIVAITLSRYFIWHIHEFPDTRRLLLIAMPVFAAASGIGVLAIRVVHFLGAETLFHLVVGTYHRPVVENRVLMFLDINDSTELTERIGALKTRSLVGKFLSDVSKPITDEGGNIYLYKGDGLIAAWPASDGFRHNRILRATDRIFEVLAREEIAFRRQFGVAPTFRIGIHGGEVVVSEQGDDKRSIGIYGDTINIAARMEQAAKEHGVGCVISGAVAAKLAQDEGLIPLGREKVRGIAAPIAIYEYRPALARRDCPPGGVDRRPLTCIKETASRRYRNRT